MTDKQLEIGWK